MGYKIKSHKGKTGGQEDLEGGPKERKKEEGRTDR